MPPRKRFHPDARTTKRPTAGRRHPQSLRARQTAGGAGWELVHPRCALERRDDMQEVETMLAAEEIDIAADELRWLLSGCPQFLDAHLALGELAARENDWKLARGHFGYGYRLGVEALDDVGASGPVPYANPSNQAWYRCGRGLIQALLKLGREKLAREVRDRLLRGDPSDPLELSRLFPKP